ncbi:MAG: ribbon-helix-helix protein, CopG family [Actinobacteria bacterium]|nr:MAG: ribbon-helix-helix protein, CopG family [Actinomycetota bacterium]
MTKLNVSIPAELLAEIDMEAEELGLSRSGLIQEASATYITSARRDREAERRRLRERSAAARMRAAGAALKVSAPDAVALLAEARAAEEGRHGG